MESFDLAIIGGFGNKGNNLEGLQRIFKKEFQQRKRVVHVSTPWQKALKHPKVIAEETERIIEEKALQEILLIGVSYGALISLLIACRKKMRNILGLVLIDGPISPHEQVLPAKIYHLLFLRQYWNRRDIAQECEKILQDMDTSKMITIGSQEDDIVPPLAKRLSGNFQDVVLEDSHAISGLDSQSLDPTKGVNIFLPRSLLYRGHGLGGKVRIIATIVRKLFFSRTNTF